MQEDKECTFTPIKDKKKLSQIIQNFRPEEFVGRNMAWEEQKQNKIAEERVLNMQKDLQECTFQPLINRNSKIFAELNENSGVYPRFMEPTRSSIQFVHRRRQCQENRVESKYSNLPKSTAPNLYRSRNCYQQ